MLLDFPVSITVTTKTMWLLKEDRPDNCPTSLFPGVLQGHVAAQCGVGLLPISCRGNLSVAALRTQRGACLLQACTPGRPAVASDHLLHTPQSRWGKGTSHSQQPRTGCKIFQEGGYRSSHHARRESSQVMFQQQGLDLQISTILEDLRFCLSSSVIVEYRSL